MPAQDLLPSHTAVKHNPARTSLPAQHAPSSQVTTGLGHTVLLARAGLADSLEAAMLQIDHLTATGAAFLDQVKAAFLQRMEG
jgi:hypothetical protein